MDNALLLSLIVLFVTLPDIILGHFLKLISARVNIGALIFITLFSYSITCIAQNFIIFRPNIFISTYSS